MKSQSLNDVYYLGKGVGPEWRSKGFTWDFEPFYKVIGATPRYDIV